MQELPPWVFTSKQIVQKPELLVSSLASFIQVQVVLIAVLMLAHGNAARSVWLSHGSDHHLNA
jgi:hypothetical protein